MIPSTATRPRCRRLPVRGLILATLLAAGPAAGQAGDDRSPPPGGDASAEPAPGSSRAVTEPAAERLVPPLVGAGFLIGGLALLDVPGREGAADLRGARADDIASFGRWYGDYKKTAVPLAAGIVLIGTALDGGRGARRGAAVVAGVFSASMANEGLNRMIGRSRPDADRGAWSFDPFGDHASFASGHAAYTFALAAAVDEIAEAWWISAPFYAAAAVTALSRVYHDRHWLSDVGAGALIGWWAGRTATRRALALLGVGAVEGAGPAIEPLVGGGVIGARVRLP